MKPISRVQNGPFLQDVLKWLPIVGWAVLIWIEMHWSDKFRATVNDELQDRPAPKLTDWAGDERKFKVAQCIAQICKQKNGWINDHFYPTDSFAAITELETGDLCEIEVLEEIEVKFDCVNWGDWNWMDPDATLEDVVNLINNNLP